MKRILSIAALLAASLPAFAETTVTITVVNASSDEGQLIVSAYNSKKTWLKKAAAEESVAITGDGATIEMQLPAGDYAFQVFHDLDGNGKMKTNFIGIPKEPTGVSNEAKGKFGPPKFKDAAIAVGDEPVTIELKLVEI